MPVRKAAIFNVTPINTDVSDLAAFERKVRRAAEAGATHIVISEAVKSRWILDSRPGDPYPNWGMLNSALFKIIVPPELERWLPADYAAENLRLVRERAKIIARYGLRSAAHFCEPFYLPEEVYRAHPDWRGPRCDHPRRARGAYYSPCMDNPEVLAMYRAAMKKFCEAAGGTVDHVYLHTNDCGAGICWSSGLYDGANGPESCRDVSLAERIRGYFRVFRQGAADAGCDIMIETNGNIGYKADEKVMDAVWPTLDDGMAVNFRTNKGTPLTSLVDVTYEFTFAPVRCIPTVFNFARQLQKAYYEPSRALRVFLYDEDFDESARLFELFMKRPTRSLTGLMLLLRKTAAGIVGEKHADLLADAWAKLDEGRINYLDTCIEGLTWTSVNQRLINRPFVLFPDALSEEDRNVFRPFQFQANGPEQADDLLDNQNTSFVRGSYAVFLAVRCLEKAKKCWLGAAGDYERAAEAAEGGLKDALTLASQRIRLLVRFINNYIDAMRFQDIVDRTDYSEKPEISSRWPQEADPRLLEYEAVNRAEIDNTYGIIKLIEGREKEMLVLAPSPELEDSFWLSEDITEQLRRKAGIMLDRTLDGKKLYRTHNK